jgi:hypothetical protein
LAPTLLHSVAVGPATNLSAPIDVDRSGTFVYVAKWSSLALCFRARLDQQFLYFFLDHRSGPAKE